MRHIALLASMAALTLLTGCGAPGGYYDTNGNWVPAPNATTEAQRVHSPEPGHENDYAPADDYRYDRRGYYDYNGYYVEGGQGPSVPASMFPPRGMCRVWFMDRTPESQPRIESCEGIRSRVPAGAYVIYGG